MQIEELTRTQLVLLVLLVSFVTSLVTGIVSVTLVNQAPAQVTQTINRVFEKVITEAAPDPSKLRALVANLSPQDAVPKMVDATLPAVVSVIATKDMPVYERYYVNPFGASSPIGDFWIPQVRQKGTERRQVSSGSGFFVSDDGYVVTNKHVVSDAAAEYSVIMNDGRKLSAKVLARDPLADVAILKVSGSEDGPKFAHLELGDSDSVRVGQTVIAIGNSLGEFQNTVSLGVISGLRRSIVAGSPDGAESLSGLIQTDAAINLGNSGGPLLDLSGQVVGMNTAVAQDADSIGFALPVNFVRKTLADVREYGEVRYVYLGVRYITITPDIKEQKKLSSDRGALILAGEAPDEPAVMSGSPAEKAGLREGDIVLEFDGAKIGKDMTIAQMVGKKRIGDEITLLISRDGKEMTVTAKLEERPANL